MLPPSQTDLIHQTDSVCEVITLPSEDLKRTRKPFIILPRCPRLAHLTLLGVPLFFFFFSPAAARRVRGSRGNQYTRQRAEEMIRALSNPPCSKSHSHFHGFKSIPAHLWPPSSVCAASGGGRGRKLKGETGVIILTCPGEKRRSRHCASRSRKSRRSPEGFPAPGSACRSKNNQREQDRRGTGDSEINGTTPKTQNTSQAFTLGFLFS